MSYTHHERVTLGSENLEGVDGDGLSLDTVGLDDSHIMPVDAEHEVRVA